VEAIEASYRTEFVAVVEPASPAGGGSGTAETFQEHSHVVQRGENCDNDHAKAAARLTVRLLGINDVRLSHFVYASSATLAAETAKQAAENAKQAAENAKQAEELQKVNASSAKHAEELRKQEEELQKQAEELRKVNASSAKQAEELRKINATLAKQAQEHQKGAGIRTLPASRAKATAALLAVLVFVLVISLLLAACAPDVATAVNGTNNETAAPPGRYTCSTLASNAGWGLAMLAIQLGFAFVMVVVAALVVGPDSVTSVPRSKCSSVGIAAVLCSTVQLLLAVAAVVFVAFVKHVNPPSTAAACMGNAVALAAGAMANAALPVSGFETWGLPRIGVAAYVAICGLTSVLAFVTVTIVLFRASIGNPISGSVLLVLVVVLAVATGRFVYHLQPDDDSNSVGPEQERGRDAQTTDAHADFHDV
jgi:hypothetical protein